MALVALTLSLVGADAGAPVLEAVREALRTSDSAAALDRIVADREPRDAARAALNVAAALYAEDHDLSGSALVTLGAVPWCLREAEASADDETARVLRSAAMALAYNLAANAWPGWGDAGVEIGATDLAIGLDMARLNLRLARELGKGPVAEANGHWIVGAQLLAAERLPEAAAEFQAAEGDYVAGNDAAAIAMARGYNVLTALLSGVEGGEAALERALAALRTLPGEDAPFYADQIEQAREVFAAR